MQRPHELRESLLEQKRRLVAAVRDGDEESVDDVLDIYRRLVERFLEHTGQYGIHFSPERAKREGAAFASRTGWKPIDWIRDDYHSALEEVFREGYKPVLLSMLYFPVSVAIRGLNQKDYFVFQKFLVEPGAYPYRLSKRLEREYLQRLVVEKLTGYFRDLVRFNLAPLMTDELTSENIVFGAEVGTGICLQFNSLMKAAIDQENRDDFAEFNERLGSLWSGIEWRTDSHDNWRMWNDVIPSTQELEEMVGAREHELHQSFEGAIVDLRRHVRLIRLGLAAWVLRGFRRGGRDVNAAREWLEEIGPLGGLSQLLETYSYALEHETQEKFGWSRWIMAEAPEAAVVSINPGVDLHYAVIYYGCDVIPEGEVEGILPESIERARLLRQSVDGGALAKSLQVLPDDEGRWESLLQCGVEQVEQGFTRLFERIRDEFDERWQELVERSDLSVGKIEEFQNGVEEGYEKSRGLKEVFDLLEAWEIRDEDEDSYEMNRWIGFHIRLDKELFVAESPTRVRVLGENFGREIGRIEVDRVFTSILVNGTRRMATRTGDIVDRLARAVSDLRDEGFGDLVVILVGSSGIGFELRSQGGLDRSKSDEFGEEVPYEGDYQEIPVFRARSRDHDGALVADVKSLGKWVQVKPWVDGDWSVIGSGFLKMSITEFDDEEAEEIVAEMGDGDGEDMDVTIDEVLRDVRLKLYSRVEWQWIEHRAAIWLEISDDELEP